MKLFSHALLTWHCTWRPVLKNAANTDYKDPFVSDLFYFYDIATKIDNHSQNPKPHWKVSVAPTISLQGNASIGSNQSPGLAQLVFAII